MDHPALAEDSKPAHIYELVRLLKAPTDPPSPGGFPKIDIAHHSWADPALSVENKAEVLVEWLLGSIGRAEMRVDRAATFELQDPIADPKYWSLLEDALTSVSSTPCARPLKAWLLPLLYRTNLASIVMKLISLSHSENAKNKGLIVAYASARVVIAKLWPLADKRAGMDVLMECFAAVLEVSANWNMDWVIAARHIDHDGDGDVHKKQLQKTLECDLAWICSTIVDSYRDMLVNFGNKKKLYTTFLSTHLPLWLRTVSRSSTYHKGLSSSAVPNSLDDLLYNAVTDTLFSLDALKQPFETFLEAFTRVPMNQALVILPRIFSSRLSATTQHRSTLFPASVGPKGSAIAMREAVRTDAMEAWKSCWRLLLHDAVRRHKDSSEAWMALVSILGVVERERLLVSTTVLESQNDQDGVNECNARVELLEARECALAVVEHACQITPNFSVSEVDFPISLSLDALSALTRIEYEVISDVIPRVLLAVMNLPPLFSNEAKDAIQRLLSDILEYHCKSRTLDTHIIALLSCFNRGPSLISSSTHPLPSVLTCDPLLAHLSPLTRALRIVLTPTQLTDLGPAILEDLRCIWTAFSAASFKRKSHVRKKQKFCKAGRSTEVLDNDNSKTNYEAIPVMGNDMGHCYSLAVAFVRAARVVSAVLANLPLHAYTKSGVWNDVGEFGWEVVWVCVRHLRKEGDVNRRMIAIVASAALRFLYDVRARLLRIPMSSMPITLGDNDRLGDSRVQELLSIVRDQEATEELVLEIVCTLLSHVSRECKDEHQQANIIFDMILSIIPRHFIPTARWSGVSKGLSHNSLGVALLCVVVDRWVDVLDAMASKEVLKRFISLLLFIPLGSTLQGMDESKNYDMAPNGILLRVLQSAQFWELQNIRSVLLSSMLEITAPLSRCAFPSQQVIPDDLDLFCVGEIYPLLVHVPSEYFTRYSRTELMKRALGGDVGICIVLQHGEKATKGPENQHTIWDKPVEDWLRLLIAIRTFLLHAGQSASALDHDTSRAFIEHLLDRELGRVVWSDTLINTTLDLISSHLVALLHAQVPGATISAASVISYLATASLFSQPSSEGAWRDVLAQATVIRLIEHLRDDCAPQSLTGEVVLSLINLHKTLSSSLASHASDATLCSPTVERDWINAWSCTLSLGQWLNIDVRSNISPIGVELATTVMRKVPHCCSLSIKSTEDICPNILSLLFEELQCIPGAPYTSHLEIIVALYSVHSNGHQLKLRTALDAQVTKSAKKLTAESFSHLLSIVVEGIEDRGLAVDQCQNLMHLSTVLLHSAPQGTLKIVQEFMTRCLNGFTGQPHLHGGSSQLRSHYLELMARHYSDRPAAVRLIDLGSTWSLLCKVLSGTSKHDNTTCFAIFHHIVSIISALVRLRRDLVIHTLPHLTFVLRQLMMITRRVRPQLGAKQHKVVTDTFPTWISASQPLTVDEGRALARLLTSLTIKTVPRVYTAASAEAPKAESLAKPFAKHASSILLAYIDALNDPLAVMALEMRRELEPGLFSLCEMLGKHNRDALMVSALGTSGKTIMKTLWVDYEKQRYVGKG